MKLRTKMSEIKGLCADSFGALVKWENGVVTARSWPCLDDAFHRVDCFEVTDSEPKAGTFYGKSQVNKFGRDFVIVFDLNAEPIDCTDTRESITGVYSVCAANLKKSLSWVALAVSRDAGRPNIQRMLFDFADGFVKVSATDGHRVHTVKIENSLETSAIGQVIVNHTEIKALLRTLTNKPVTLTFQKQTFKNEMLGCDWACNTTKSGIVVGGVVIGQVDESGLEFPDLARVIPASAPYAFRVNLESVMEVLEEAKKPVKNPNQRAESGIIRFGYLSDSVIRVFAELSNKGLKSVGAKGEGFRLPSDRHDTITTTGLMFNARYLLEVLKHIKADNDGMIELRSSGSARACLVESGEYQAVIMPVLI